MLRLLIINVYVGGNEYLSKILLPYEPRYFVVFCTPLHLAVSCIFPSF